MRRDKGTGAVYYSESRQRWVGQLVVGVLPSGKDKVKTVTAKTKREAKTKLDKLREKHLTGTLLDKSKITIPQLATSINENKKALNIVHESGYKNNKDNIKIIEDRRIGDIPIQKLTEPVLTDFFASITNYSNSVIGKVYRLCNSACKKAIQMDIIIKNPT